jgi:virulence factor Mce-like protein
MRRILIAMLAALAVLSALIWYEDSRTAVGMFSVTADVAQAPNLFEGARVMVRGVEVGQITKVEPHAGFVRLTMNIQNDVKIPADAHLSVIPITVISDRYVQLFPTYRKGPLLAEGDRIPESHTSIPAELDDVLKQLNGLLTALAPKGKSEAGPLSRLVTNLDKALKGRSQNLAGTLKGSSKVLENLAGSQADITALISNLDTLFGTLANRSSEIGLVNQRFALVARALEGDRRDLQGTIKNLAFLSNQGTKLVSNSGDRLGESFSRLGTVIDAVLRHQDQLIEGMKWSNVISEALGATDRSGKGLYAYSGRQAPPGVAGAEYNYRIDARDTIGCERIRAVSGTILAIHPGVTVEDFASQTLESFIPEPYKDDLAFLLLQLAERCTPITIHNPPTLDAQAAAAAKTLERQLGEKKFMQLLGMWLLGSSPGGVAP